jgi:AcrR family transcriptional regulator
MKINRRTNAARSAATREALVAAARGLFATQGYNAVGTDTIVEAAGVTRGALYHHFTDKTELFGAVFEVVERELIERIRAAVMRAAPSDPVEAIRLSIAAWLDASAEPEILRIALLDAPAVLGWAGWRQIAGQYSDGLARELIAYAIEAGKLPRQPVPPLADVMLGAVREAALYIANAADSRQARQEVGAVLDRMVRALAGG